MTRLKFSKTALGAITLPPAGKRLTFYDAEIAKLALRVSSTGSRTFYVVKRAGTSIAWVKLGAFPEMTVEQARIEAQKTLAQFATGSNPADVRRASRAELTLAQFFDEYAKRHGEKKRSWAADEQRFRDYINKSLGKRKLSEITRQMASRVLADAEASGKSVATVRNIRALLSGMFAKAVEWGFLKESPIYALKVSGKKVSRDRFLQPDEMPRFFSSLAEEPSATARDFILLALLTGARRSNLCAMRWKEIDFGLKVWRIPRTKNDEPHTVTLSPEAIEVLKGRRVTGVPGEEFVFPGSGASGHIQDPKKGVMRVMARAGIPYGRDVENGVTLHDLRRTLGSWQARTGASLLTIGKSLNHKSQQATQIYAHMDLDPVRQSVNTATHAMIEAAGLMKRGA